MSSGATTKRFLSASLGFALCACFFAIATYAAPDPGPKPSPEPASEAANRVEDLQRRLDSGQTKLTYADDGHGYLASVLRELKTPTDSQVLVFSATSLQFSHINNKTPRAIYHQDDVTVGSVLDGQFIEIITSDRDKGVAFYTLAVAKTDKPHFDRRSTECFACHSYASAWTPGLLVADTIVSADGYPFMVDPRHIFHLTDDRTPFERRYGGWYVTGSTGAMEHRGNLSVDPKTMKSNPMIAPNPSSLSSLFDTKRYLAPGSDIVSLLTLEHQSGATNLILQLNAQYKGATPAPNGWLEATQADVDETVTELVNYLTFASAAPLTSPVAGSSTFAETFVKAGPTDSLGRSLRQFDLKTRLFRYPLSYMIYSDAFDALNAVVKEQVLRGIYEALKTRPDGLDAIDIVAATKTGLPDFWRPL